MTNGVRIADVIDRALNASFNSDSIPTLNSIGYSVQIVWDGVGAPDGTFIISESNNDVDFEPVSGATIATGGIAGTAFFNLSESYAAFARVEYTRVGGGIGSAAVADAVVKG